MPSEMVLFQKFDFPEENTFVRIKVWKVNPKVKASPHNYKYSLVYVVNGVCALRYDNEAGKGDHKHIGENEQPVSFSTIENLIAQFREDVKTIRR